MRHAFWIMPLFVLLMAAGPTTGPVLSLERARSLIENLADPDPARRDGAREALLDLSRAELPGLLEAAVGLAPLAPDQLAALREAVSHIYLSAEPYPNNPEVGFLGIGLENVVVLQADGGRRAARPGVEGGEEPVRLGIVVDDTSAGLAGHRYLQAGDVIFGVDDARYLTDREQFSQAVRKHRAGEVVRLHLLRHGRVMEVRPVLSPRPLDTERGPFNAVEFRNRRELVADQYWDVVWRPRLEPAGPASAPSVP